MNFTDQDIVTLSGAHSLGRAHSRRSGFVGPWTSTPLVFNNAFFSLLVNNFERYKPKVLTNNKTLFVDDMGMMMLPTDIVLFVDPIFKTIVQQYAADQSIFFSEFKIAFAKLLENGVAAGLSEKFVSTKAMPLLSPLEGTTRSAAGDKVF
jgi:catalase (peroxidase I)